MTIKPFVLHVVDLLSREYEPLRPRRMFGGHGIYHGDLMFALVGDNIVYVKTDDISRSDFLAAGLPQFPSSCTGGEQPALAYFAIPPEALEDPDVLKLWAIKGYEAARRDAEAIRWKRRGKN
ncbi:MAG: TfoX/Sxy family protein [Candidatus Sericytochromatia bacterium]|nr:TfoX/Sxy family protein [Candidatus Sericytochromatia bacterium]